MRYIADLHIHSPYSRATSKSSNLAGLAAWSIIKGIDVIGSGDFTHPGWFRELRENLQPAEPGFFKLKDPNIPQVIESVLTDRANKCRFILTAEISSIYKRHGSVRKIHNILFVPDFESASRINTRLAGIGNIESDGRPILGLDAHDLLEIVLELAPEGFMVPAHIWTPWFSLFGSKSGFNSIDDCFGDLSKYIFALETGLSSDPEMNRLVSALDRFTLISNSDCHSPGKLGREANIFACGFNFFSMKEALKNPTVGGFQGTIEFFPEEGKYHHDGHRKCGINLDPHETREVGGICPVCSKPLTIGVMHRVMELADREEPYYPSGSPAYYSLIPLTEVLGEIFSRGPATKTVLNEYGKLISMFDSEFNLLLNVSVEEINERYSPVLGEAVKRIREGKVIRRAGFDGEFGVIKVFDEGELKELLGQFSLFENRKVKKKTDSSIRPPLLEFSTARQRPVSEDIIKSLNEEQTAAVNSAARHIVVTAGPGTGKTFTLVARIRKLIEKGGVKPDDITAITFTNRAAEEMKERLAGIEGLDGGNLFIGTFHSFCLDLLRSDGQDLTVIDEVGRNKIISQLLPKLSSTDFDDIHNRIELYYQAQASDLCQDTEQEIDGPVNIYIQELKERHGIDLSGIISQVIHKLRTEDNFLRKVNSSSKYLFIDEFQDLNRAQFELVRILAANNSVFAIGDTDQAIYGFRGSSPEFFYHFIDEFEAETITLGKNYRSAKNILQAATAVIANNYETENSPSKLMAEHSDSGTIEFYQAPSSQAEAEYVVRRIEEFMGGISHFSINSGRVAESTDKTERSFRDFAVLYRLTQQAQHLREALERRGIPFQIVNVKPFFMHREIRPLYYWLRAAGSESETAEAEVYFELLRTFPGVGQSTLALLEKQLPYGGFTDFFTLSAELSLPKALNDSINDLQRNLQEFRENVTENGLSGPITESMNYLRVNNNSDDAKRFLELAGSFGSDLFGFVHYLHRNETATVYDEEAEAVSLMTMHGAKGLEFPVVFITGMEEGIFPCQLHTKEKGVDADVKAATSVQEERRLFYVGVTRAQNSLVLTSSVTRPIFGSYKSRQVSQFVNEIPQTICQKIKQDRPRKKKPGAKQMKLF
jgi:uncharacterized protein (TIGR00375 family)